MAIANLQELCRGFCDLAGLNPPALAPDDKGTWAATIQLRKVDITLQQFSDRDTDCVFIIADLGEVPENQELEVCSILMRANFHMVSESPPTFSRCPGTRHAMLHWTYPLMQASAADLYQRVLALVNTALDWRGGHWLDDAAAAQAWFAPFAGTGALPAEEAQSAQAKFDALYRETCRALGQPDTPALPTDSARAFEMQYGSTAFFVAQSIEEAPDLALVLVRLGRPRAPVRLEDIASLMELNFRFTTESRALRIVQDPAGGDCMVVCSCPLAGATPQVLLTLCGALAQLALEWLERTSEVAQDTALATA